MLHTKKASNLEIPLLKDNRINEQRCIAKTVKQPHKWGIEYIHYDTLLIMKIYIDMEDAHSMLFLSKKKADHRTLI